MADKEITIQITTETDVSQLDDLTNAIDEVKTNADEASQSTDNLKNSVDGIDSTPISETADEADNLRDSAGGANEEISELGNSLGLIDSAVMMGLAQEVGQLGTQAEGMAQDMNTAAISVGQLATQAGIAEPQMISLINNISNATFPQEEAMQYVTLLDQLGVSADQLGQSATNMDRINDAFGIGSTAVTNLTGNLYAMGVPADHLETSFNALAYAQSNVAGGVDKFSTILQRLGPQFSEYGFNVDQASVITAAATQQWGSGRKAISNLSSALKDANGDTAALEQALGLEAGALSNASTLTGQYAGQLQALADEEAEHKTFIDQLGAAWEDFSLALSPVLSPMMSIIGLVGQFGQFAMQVNGIITLAQTLGILGSAESALIPIQWAEAAAGWASIGWIVLAIALGIALGLAIWYLYENCDWFRQGVDQLVAALQWLASMIWTVVTGAIQWLSDLFNQFTQQLGLDTNNWMEAVLGFILFIPQLPLQVGIALVNALAKAMGFGNNFVQTMISSASNAVNGFISYIASLPGQFANELNNMLSAVDQWAATLPQKFWDAGVNAVRNFVSALGIASPGTMQRKLIAEMEDTGDRIPDATKGIIRNVGIAGEDIVDSFGEPELGFSMTGTLNEQMQSSSTGYAREGFRDLIINIGSVDDDDRVNDIVDAVTRALSWDNTKAGRTV